MKRSGRLVAVLTAGIVMAASAVAAGNIAVESSEAGSLLDAPGAFVELPEAALHYQRIGNPDHPTVVLVHGFGVEGGASWAGLAAQLQGTHDLVIVDMAGFGYSERPTQPGPELSHRGRAATLAALADQLALGPSVWVGASYGGGVTAELALDRPDLVSKLVIVDGQLSDLGGGFFQSLGAAGLGVGRAATYVALTSGPVARSGARSSCPGTCPIRGDTAYRDEVAALPGTTDGFVAMSRTDLDTTLPESLEALTQPVMLIWGQNDELIPLEQGEAYSRRIDGASLVVIPDAGHNPHIDSPSLVAEAIRNFVDGPAG